MLKLLSMMGVGLGIPCITVWALYLFHSYFDFDFMDDDYSVPLFMTYGLVLFASIAIGATLFFKVEDIK